MSIRNTLLCLLWLVASTTVACASLPARAPTRPVAAPTNQPTAAAAEADVIGMPGIFTAPSQATLTFKDGGLLTEVRVQEGAKVRQGDPLAALDKTELYLAVQQAQAALAGARARLDQAKSPATDAEITAAKAAVDAAQKNYDRVRAGPTPDQVAQLKAQADNAKAIVAQAQAAYDRIGGSSNPQIAMAPQSAALQQATNNLRAAEAVYNDAVTHPTAAELAAARDRVEQAQAALARLAPTSNDLAIAQAAVDGAQAALALARQHLANATLVAPFDGTVLSLGAHVGETVGPTTAILTLADLSHLQVQARVDQDLLEQIQIGQPVSIVPDAFKTRTVTGNVSQIGWLGTTTAGVANVPVTIDVNPNNVPLRPGLTATVEFDLTQ